MRHVSALCLFPRTASMKVPIPPMRCHILPQQTQIYYHQWRGRLRQAAAIAPDRARHQVSDKALLPHDQRIRQSPCARMNIHTLEFLATMNFLGLAT